jgi:hypothetical protein
MRFHFAVLAAAATLLATTNAAAAEQNQISQMNPEREVRSLRYVEEDALDEEEERAKGFNVKALSKIVKSKQGTLSFDVAKQLSRNKQDWAIGVWVRQNLNQKEFAQKLGMKSVDDVTHVNAKLFGQLKSHFPAV